MSIKAKVDDKLRKKVARYVKANYQRIDVTPFQGMFNFRCFENAVQFAEDQGYQVVEVMYIDHDGDPILHYINRDANGVYFETTLGWKAKVYEYYLLREIHPNDYHSIDSVFAGTLDYYFETFGKWWHRLLGITRCV